MKRSTIASLIGMLLSAPVFAEDFKLNTDNVIVTSSRFEEDLSSNPSVKIITHEEIQNSPSVSIPDLLRTLAGINIQSLHGNSGTDTTVDIRGFGDTAISNTLVLVNGQRLNSPDSSNIQWASIPVKAIDHIEVISGDGTILYGDRATGGVINIITDKSGKTAASLTTTIGSYGYKSVDGYLSGSLDHDGYFNTFIHTSDENGYRENSAETSHSVSGRIGYNLDSVNTFIDYSVFHIENGLPGVLSATDYAQNPRSSEIFPITSLPFSPKDLNQWQAKEGLKIRPGFSVALNQNLELSTELLFSYEKTKFTDPDQYDIKKNREITSYGFTPKLKWTSDPFNYKNVMIGGYDYYYGNFNGQTTGILSNTGADNYSTNANQTTQSVYLQNTTSITQKLDAIVGMRSEQIKQSAQQDAFCYYSYYSSLQDCFTPYSYIYQGVTYNALYGDGNPSMSGNQKSTKNAYQLTLNYHDVNWGSYFKSGTSFRFSNLDEIFGSDPVNANTIFYGSFLKPQTSYNNEVGLTYKDTIIESRVSVYRMDIDNEIAYDPNSYSNVNLAPTTHKGIEAQLAYKILENLRAKLSYSYTEVKFTSGLYAGNIVPNVPENMGSAQLLWDQHQYGKYVAQVNYVGSRYFSGDFYNTDTKLASYTTLDLKAAWEFKPITVSFTGMNMLDKKYSPMGTVYGGVNYYYPGNARTLYLSLTYNFK